MEKMKISQENTITEIMEKHAKELKDQGKYTHFLQLFLVRHGSHKNFTF